MVAQGKKWVHNHQKLMQLAVILYVHRISDFKEIHYLVFEVNII